QTHEITHTTFIESSAIVDHQNVARCSALERLQKNIDATHMSSGTRATNQAATRNQSLQERRRAAHRDVSANACIRQMGGGQRREPPPSLLVIHCCLSSTFPRTLHLRR